MGWRRLGRVWGPSGERPWARSHASNPVVVPLGGQRIRAFFGTRDADNRSSIGWIDATLGLEPGSPMTVEAVGDRPLLVPGSAGAFDDCGIGMGCVVADEGGEDRLYYMGW